MIIKKFTAKTEKEAIENARAELGEGVVVMNVKPVKPKGLFAFLKTPMMEVTVALEEESEKLTAAVSAINSVIASSQNKEEEAAKSASANNTPVMETHEKQDGSAVKEKRENNSAIEEKLDSLQSLLEQQLQKPEEEKEEQREGEAEKEETETDKFMRLLHNTMLENEVDEKYAKEIMDEIELINKPSIPFDYALANIYQKMILKFGKPSGIEPAANGIKLVFFIGPTGVGKTTTIAKIASKFRVDEKKKVALLTADTYRIAAAEQLRTYANILDTPLNIIYSPEELNQAVEKLEDFDVILVDTAGFSHKNVEQKEDIRRLIKSVDVKYDSEVYLVLSATTKYKDLIEISDVYKEISNYKIIFTKLDETTTYGSILNIKLYSNAEVSYITNGQNVPDDIEVFNSQKIVKRLLGGR